MKIGEFVRGFTVVFWISYLCWILGSYANIAATPDKLEEFGISWSLNLTPEAGFIVALLAGLIVGNFMPRLAWSMQAAIRPEWYIKTGIVLLGGYLVIQAADQLGLLGSVMFRGLCAIVEAYLIYWAVVYFVARKVLQVSPRVGGAAGLRHFDLRRVGGRCHRRGDQGAARGADHGLLAGGDLRRGRTGGSSLCRAAVPLR